MNKLVLIKKDYTNVVVIALLLIVLAVMTVGFSYYNQTLNFSGSAFILGSGNIFISNVVAANLHNATATPTYDATSIDFNLYFDSTNANNNTDYSASFNVTVTNESVLDYTWYLPSYAPTVFGMNMERYYDTSLVQTTVSGISTGDTIPAKSTITYTVTFTFTNPDVNETLYEIDGDYRQTTTNLDTGSLVVSAIVSSGDLRGSNTICAYQVEVINTYASAKSFTLAVVDSSKFVVTDASGNSPLPYTIAANTSQTYTFYLMKANGAQYGTDTQRVDLTMNDGSTNHQAGYVIALVDQNVFFPDTTAPIISNVSATIINTVGNVVVSWNGTDNVAIDHYEVIVFNSSNVEQSRVATSDASTSLTVTGLSDTNYYFTVIGYDTATPNPNTATATEISQATTASGHACRTNEEFYDWHFDVTHNTGNNITFRGNNSVNRGDTYTCTLTPSNNYEIDSLTITMGDVTLTTDDYSRQNNTLTIPNVTGNLSITATATGGGCLAFGTKVLLANGTYKNIEDITYEDLLYVYNHVTGQFVAVHPLWIEKPDISNSYIKISFDDGNFLNVVNHHSLYNVDLKRFVDVQNNEEFHVGSNVYKVENNQLVVIKVSKIEEIKENINYTSIVTPKFYNIIANDVMTVDTNASISNFYGFKEKAVYSEGYQLISNGEQLSYDMMKDYFPYYLYQGLNLQNGMLLLNTTFQYQYLSEFINQETIWPDQKNGKYFFAVSIDFQEKIQKNICEQESLFILPESDASYYIETSTGMKYAPSDEVAIHYNMHFIAIYE